MGDVCCNEDVICTKMVGVCSSRFLFEVLLLISSSCLDLVLMRWHGNNTSKNELFSQLVSIVTVHKRYEEFGIYKVLKDI